MSNKINAIRAEIKKIKQQHPITISTLLEYMNQNQRFEVLMEWVEDRRKHTDVMIEFAIILDDKPMFVEQFDAKRTLLHITEILSKLK